MNFIIIGAGIIGVSTAWYLQKSGYNVTVLESLSDAGLATSFANAGMLTPGYAAPWATPDVLQELYSLWRMPYKPVTIRWDLSLYQLNWFKWLYRFSNVTSYQQNRAIMHQLARYNLTLLHQLVEESGIEYEGRSQGTLQLYRSEEALAKCRANLQYYKTANIQHHLMESAEGLLKYEPGLKTDHLAGALQLADDETGNCFLLTQNLRKLAEAAGVTFHFNHEVEAIITQGDKIEALQVEGKRWKADRYILATGSDSRYLLRQLGIKVPIYPVKGCSLTIPILDFERAPQSALLDDHYKISITRLGDSIRVGGIAEFSGWNMEMRDQHRKTLEYVIEDLFPGVGDLANAEFWMGARPMTPDGPPIISGIYNYKNLYLNSGHGTFGWTMGLASGKLMVDMIDGHPSELSRTPFRANRY